MKRIFWVVAMAATVWGVQPAVAAPIISFEFLEARWENSVGGNVLTPVPGTFGDTSTISWGSGTNFSSYVFDARDTDFIGVPGASIVLGDFTHLNFPIATGTGITSVDLRLRGNLSITNSSGATEAFLGQEYVFSFSHFETSNAATPCANGQANGSGVNVNGCADIVTVVGTPGSSDFLVDGEVLTLNIEGFQLAGLPITQFDTAERLANTAQLVASFQATRISEPSALGVFASSLAVLGFMGWRRRREGEEG